MSVEVRKITQEEIENYPEYRFLLDEYGKESAIKGIAPSPQLDQYRALSNAGYLHIFGAFLGSKLIGAIQILSTVLPHYGRLIATTESFFVSKTHRKTGAGSQLLRQAETFCKDQGVFGLFVSANTESVLSKVLPAKGFVEANTVFFKPL